MDRNISSKRVLILATDGVEQVELTQPRQAFEDAGATTELISLKPGKIKGWNHTDWGDTFEVDNTVDQVRAEDYDALFLPGGAMNPDKLRMDKRAVSLVRAFFDAHKP